MVRGRRARAVTNGTVDVTTAKSFNGVMNGSKIFDDQYCASPKRKDLKIDDEKLNKNSKATIKVVKSNEIIGTKTRSKTIKNYFKTDEKLNEANCSSFPSVINGYTDSPIKAEICYALIEDDMSSSSSDGNSVQSFSNGNIFLQEPVLSLNVDKSPNQPSSIKINKMIEIEPVFSATSGYHVHLNGQFNKIVTLNTSPKREIKTEESTSMKLNNCYSSLNFDNNSCDSGVVLDTKLELSPSRRRKPTTPHRILCPSPIKHPSVDRTRHRVTTSSFAAGGLSPLVKNSNCTTTATSGYLNGAQKRHPKSRRRLNPQQHENHSSIASPQLIGGVTLNEALKMNNNSNSSNNFSNINQKSILNSAKNPTAEQNTNNNNYKLSHQNHSNGQMHPPHLQNGQPKPKTQQNGTTGGNREMTDFFPVRRSVRKTKTAVKEEMMRGLEMAIIEERAEGLKVVQHFEGKGRGIVADRHFQRGEFVVEYIGDLIDMTEANQREKKYSLDENAGCYMYYFKHKNQQYCIDATAESGKLGRLVNHSRNGNLSTKVVVVKNRPHLVLIAKDDIPPNEELTYDYGDRSKESLQHHPWLAL